LDSTDLNPFQLVNIKIIRVTPGTNPIYKSLAYGRPGFAMDVTYHLADGREVAGRVASERKKNLPAELARVQSSIAAGAMSVCFDEHGNFLGTRMTYGLGATGLVPEAWGDNDTSADGEPQSQASAV
jgi:hypothetical protein